MPNHHGVFDQINATEIIVTPVKNNMATETSTMNVRCNFRLGKGGFPASLVSFTGGTNSLSRVSSHVFFFPLGWEISSPLCNGVNPSDGGMMDLKGETKHTPQVGMLHMGDPRWSFFVVFGFVCFFLVGNFCFKQKHQKHRPSPTKSQVIFINWPRSIKSNL